MTTIWENALLHMEVTWNLYTLLEQANAMLDSATTREATNYEISEEKEESSRVSYLLDIDFVILYL